MSLRDQFKKANLISDKEARRLAHEARVERTTKGREGLEQESAQRQQEIERLQKEDRERVRKETERLEREKKQREEWAAVEVLLADAKKPGPGAVRFYFATDEGFLPWLELSPREAQELRAGSLCVVRVGAPNTHTYRLLPLEATKLVARLRPEGVALAPRGTL
ncbi:MAG: DUF2058 family protein [Planctomycetes bacterium]|nr:DUF2058 family protein [Planctomycetota bacterium]